MLCSRAYYLRGWEKRGPPRYGWYLLDWRSYFPQGRAPHVWSVGRASVQSAGGAGALGCLHGQHSQLSVRALVFHATPRVLGLHCTGFMMMRKAPGGARTCPHYGVKGLQLGFLPASQPTYLSGALRRQVRTHALGYLFRATARTCTAINLQRRRAAAPGARVHTGNDQPHVPARQQGHAGGVPAAGGRGARCAGAPALASVLHPTSSVTTTGYTVRCQFRTEAGAAGWPAGRVLQQVFDIVAAVKQPWHMQGNFGHGVRECDRVMLLQAVTGNSCIACVLTKQQAR